MKITKFLNYSTALKHYCIACATLRASKKLNSVNKGIQLFSFVYFEPQKLWKRKREKERERDEETKK